MQRLLNRVSAKQENEDLVGISPVRLGMQVAFGRVRRKTVKKSAEIPKQNPTGPGGSLN